MNNNNELVVNIPRDPFTKQMCDVCGKSVVVLAMKFSIQIDSFGEYYADIVNELLPYYVNKEYGICYKCFYEKLGIKP